MKEKFDFNKFWAMEFKKNPEKNRKVLNKFIDSQIKMAQKRLNQLDPEKLIHIFNIKNEEVIQRLLNNS